MRPRRRLVSLVAIAVSCTRLARRAARSSMNQRAQSPSRPTTKCKTISFVSASIAVQVHVSPAPSTGAFMLATFFCFAAVKHQISSICTRLDFTLRILASWKQAQNLPASTSSFDTVLIDTSASRETDRMNDSSQSMARIRQHWATESLFICFLYELLCLGRVDKLPHSKPH